MDFRNRKITMRQFFEKNIYQKLFNTCYRFNKMIISRYKISMPDMIKNKKEIHGMPKICGWMSVKLKTAEARSIAAARKDRVRRLAMA